MTANVKLTKKNDPTKTIIIKNITAACFFIKKKLILIISNILLH